MPRKPATSYEVVRMHDLSCVVHLHSTHSDGTGTVRQIARAAARARADVVLLTDHDTLAAKRNGEEGWYGDVLLLAGEEVSPLQRDHYLAFGIDTEIRHRGLTRARSRGRCGTPAASASPPIRSPRGPSASSGRACRSAASTATRSTGSSCGTWPTTRASGSRASPAALRFLAMPARVLDHPPERNMRALGRAVPDPPGRRRSAASTRTSTASGSGRSCRVRVMAYHRSFKLIRTHVLCEEAPARRARARPRARLRRAAGGPLLHRRRGGGAGARLPLRGRRRADGRRGARRPPHAATCARRCPPGCACSATAPRSPPPPAPRSTPTSRSRAPTGWRRAAPSRGRERTWILSNPIYLR